ncbi:EpsG family protein [Cronobacter malonaticus]|uniref:EpsG family protein n=1 Tax=Cronobacter malonaticus TaxID=413503 RepID=UPI000CFC5A3F|nr:EpsG family protein [Cronobacter malonaticus]ELY4027695.1 EpsG family protein [Cronobacter malonaticus]MDI7686033.1 EpsG family protein [Cronobacter malonaticus]
MPSEFNNIYENKIMPVLYLIALSVFVVYPNTGGVILILLVLITGIKIKINLNAYILFVITLFSGILATKALHGEGNDYVTYYYNVLEGSYPTWAESKTDFFFWECISAIMKLTPQKDPFVFFWIVNFISFFPYMIYYNYLCKVYGIVDSSKIASIFFILLLSSFSFWNLYGNYIRQAWVITYFIGVVILLIEKRKIPALAFSMVVAMSHSSGIILLIIIPLYRLVHKVNLQKIAAVSIVFLSITFFVPVSSLLDSLLPGYISSKLNFYASWDGSDFGKVAIIRVLMISFMVYLLDFLIFRCAVMRSELYKFMVFTLISLTIMVALVSNISKVVERLYYFVVLIFYIIISLQYNHFKKVLTTESNIVATIFLIYGAGGFLIYNLYSSLSYNPAYYDANIISFFVSKFRF